MISRIRSTFSPNEPSTSRLRKCVAIGVASAGRERGFFGKERERGDCCGNKVGKGWGFGLEMGDLGWVDEG